MGKKIRRQKGMWNDPEHKFPMNDTFKHWPTMMCPCKPRMETAYIPGIGGGAWYQHNQMIAAAELDTIPPAWLLTDNDPED